MGIPLKTYSLSTDNGVFKVEVSAQEDGNFAASIFYGKLTKGRLLKVPGEPGHMNVERETQRAATEDEALAKIVDFARGKFQKVGRPILVTPAGTDTSL